MAIDEVVGTTILSRNDWLYPFFDPLHPKGKREKWRAPGPPYDEPPLLIWMLVEEREPATQNHHPVSPPEPIPPMAPPTQYQSLVMVASVGFPHLFVTKRPPYQCYCGIANKKIQSRINRNPEIKDPDLDIRGQSTLPQESLWTRSRHRP